MKKKEGALSAAQLRGIGLVASRWSHLEFILQVKIWLVLNVKYRVGMIITAEMQSAQMIILLGMLVKYHWEHLPQYSKFKSLLEEIDALRIERNKAVHFIYAHTEKGAMTLKVKRTPKLERHKQFSAKELETMANKIKMAGVQLRNMQLPRAEPTPEKLYQELAQEFGWQTPSPGPKA